MKQRIEAARASGAVSRFHTARLLVPESVAEHTFNLMNILMLITEGAVSRRLLIAALVHDMGETATGDIPANVKKKLTPEVLSAVNQLEEAAVEFIHPSVRELEVTDDEWHLLTLADRLDGLLKCLDEIRLGNSTLIPIGQRYVSYIHALLEKSESGAVFATHCINSFHDEVYKNGR